MVDVVIIGAGPYGLSIAAHLGATGVAFRIFGSPMRTWLKQMPKGMRLKSDGFASNLYDPSSTFTLADYCKERGIPYADKGLPVDLQTFSTYGLEFQKRFVPQLEDKQVVGVSSTSTGFEVQLEGEEVVATRKVVIAAGLGYYHYLPPVLSGLPEDLVTHSSKYGTLDQFKGREVAVIGGGSSAADLAALLHETGANVHLIARKPAIKFHDPPASTPPPLMARVRNPSTGIGSGWKLVFCASAPQAFHRLPEKTRLDAVARILGPAPGWFVKDQVVGKVQMHLGVTVDEAIVQKSKIRLQLKNGAPQRQSLVADHVIAATGYKVDLRRLTFLEPGVLSRIGSVQNTPILSSNFESSVPGLYFVGTSAANSFGPVLRFAFGAGFTARRISKHLKQFATRPGPASQ